MPVYYPGPLILAQKVGEDLFTPLNQAGGPPIYACTNFISDGETHNQAISTLDCILAALAPATPGLLTGKSLTITTPSSHFQAILPSGLSAASPNWYYGAHTVGSVINYYVISSSYILSTPSPSSVFYVGRAGGSPWGTSTHLLTTPTLGSIVGSTYANITTTGTGVAVDNGIIAVNSLTTYNTIWEKANGYISYTSAEGYSNHAYHHTIGGTTNIQEMWYDPNGTQTPSFTSNPTIVEGSVVTKWLSGIKYYGHNTTLYESYTAATGIFNRCYNATQVSLIVCTGSPNIAVNPLSVPVYTDAFVVTNQIITLSITNQSSMSSPTDPGISYLTTSLYKPDPAYTASYTNTNMQRAVCTYGTVSTATSDTFFDEAQRLVLNSLTAWDSTTSLNPNGPGDAQVRNGYLVYGITDYPSKTGSQEYQRLMYKPSASLGLLTCGSFLAANLQPYGSATGITMLIYLEDNSVSGGPVYFDLGVAYGTGSDGHGHTRDGTTRSLAFGGQNLSTTTGNAIGWNLGIYNTANNGALAGYYRLIIIFNDNSQYLTSITGS